MSAAIPIQDIFAPDLHERIRNMDVESLVQVTYPLTMNLKTKGTVPFIVGNNRLRRSSSENSTEVDVCNHYIRNFSTIIQRFQDLNVDWNPATMGKAVQNFLQQIKDAAGNDHTSGGIGVPTLDMFFSLYNPSVNQSRRCMESKALKCKKQSRLASNKFDEKLKSVNPESREYARVLLKMNLEKLKGNVWAKWEETIDLMLEAVELIRCLEYWKLKISNRVEMGIAACSSVPPNAVHFNEANNQLIRMMNVQTTLNELKFNWDAFKMQPAFPLLAVNVTQGPHYPPAGLPLFVPIRPMIPLPMRCLLPCPPPPVNTPFFPTPNFGWLTPASGMCNGYYTPPPPQDPIMPATWFSSCTVVNSQDSHGSQALSHVPAPLQSSAPPGNWNRAAVPSGSPAQPQCEPNVFQLLDRTTRNWVQALIASDIATGRISEDGIESEPVEDTAEVLQPNSVLVTTEIEDSEAANKENNPSSFDSSFIDILD